MTEQLKPCPFCGRYVIEEDFFDYQKEQTKVYASGCTNCGSTGSDESSIRNAIMEWNHRASPWISVDERLPTEEKMYLVKYKHIEDIDVVRWCNHDGGFFAHIYSDAREEEKWMPIPD